MQGITGDTYFDASNRWGLCRETNASARANAARRARDGLITVEGLPVPGLKKLAKHMFESATAESGVRYRMKDGYAAFRSAFAPTQQCWWPEAQADDAHVAAEAAAGESGGAAQESGAPAEGVLPDRKSVV